MIEQIQINDWRQFDNLTIDFDKRLTRLTGANGSGKTTILTFFLKHLVNLLSLLAMLVRPPMALLIIPQVL